MPPPPASCRAQAGSAEPVIRCCSIPHRTTHSRCWRARLPTAEASASRRGANGRSRYIVSGVAPAKLEAWAAELWVTGERTSGAAGAAVSGSPPRIGLGNDGWTEWLFDTHDVKYTKVTNADLQAGNLSSRFDVLVLPAGLGGGFGRGGAAGGGAGGGGGRGGRGAGPGGGRTERCDARGRRIHQERRHRAHLGQRRRERRAGASASRAEHHGWTLAERVFHRHVDHAGSRSTWRIL